MRQYDDFDDHLFNMDTFHYFGSGIVHVARAQKT